MTRRDYSVEPVQVGEPATYGIGSDCYPYEVVKVSESGKTIHLRALSYRVVEGSSFDGSAKYEYESNPDGSIMKATLRKDGRYRRVGCTNYGGVFIGHARAYRDPHF